MKNHLEKAAGYIARGENFYRKAAEEILEARRQDPGLTYQVIGDRLGRSKDWVRKLINWVENDASSPTPYAGQAPDVDRRKARQVAREQPDVVVSGLAPEEKANLAAAALGSPEARRQFAGTRKGNTILGQTELERRKEERRKEERDQEDQGAEDRLYVHRVLTAAADARRKAHGQIRTDLESAERTGQLGRDDSRELVVASLRMTMREYEALAIIAEGGTLDEELEALLAAKE